MIKDKKKSINRQTAVVIAINAVIIVVLGFIIGANLMPENRMVDHEGEVFAFTYPEDWNVIESGNQVTVTSPNTEFDLVVSSEGESTNADYQETSIVFSKNPPEDLIPALEDETKNVCDGLKELYESEDYLRLGTTKSIEYTEITRAGDRGCLVDWEFDIAFQNTSVAMKSATYYLIDANSGNIYTYVVTSSGNDMQNFQVGKQIVESVRFE